MIKKSNNIDYLTEKILGKNADLIDILGVSISLLYSKEMFKKNQDIAPFIKSVYNIEFLPYVMKSRTLIVARIAKDINSKDATDLKAISLKILEFLNENSSEQIIDKKKSIKRKNANDKMKTWLEGL